MKCERGGCRAATEDLFDYCAKCSKNLCAEHMAAGCCGSVPATSGNGEDHADAGTPVAGGPRCGTCGGSGNGELVIVLGHHTVGPCPTCKGSGTP